MKAMILETPRTDLRPIDLPVPIPAPDQVLIRVHACGVCRTDLHVLDGELTEPKLPLILGHEIVGLIEAKGDRVERLAIGDRVGVPWLAIHAAFAATAFRGERTCAIRLDSPATRSTAAMRSTRLRISVFVFPSPKDAALRKRPRFCARA
jgi:D-arabinose 1-dehydrogenase-like Zn-dependent alcohol dehydrogenase